jgi:hypothetical protein
VIEVEGSDLRGMHHRLLPHSRLRIAGSEKSSRPSGRVGGTAIGRAGR